jgi:hypothetical protein
MTHGLAREGWDLDLRHGVAREDALVNLLLHARVEVKSDGRCPDTGRLFIETQARNGVRVFRIRAND